MSYKVEKMNQKKVYILIGALLLIAISFFIFQVGNVDFEGFGGGSFGGAGAGGSW